MAAKSFQEKLKSFFKSGIAKGSISLPEDAEIILEPEILAGLDNTQDISIRLKVMSELIPIVKSRRLQEHAVELLWVKVQDLAMTKKGQAEVNAEYRKKSWAFLEAVIQGQYEHLDIMRGQFFRLIKTFDQAPQSVKDEYLSNRIQMLDVLTQKGKDILHFEEEIGPLTIKLWPLILTSRSPDRDLVFLTILINLLTYNSAYMDTDVVSATILALTKVCSNAGSQEEVKLCLNILDAVICYNHIPNESLFPFICLLSRIVNMEAHCTEAWKIVRRLMGTHLGHSALYCLCQILQTPEFKKDVALIRGSVFYVGMALWGSQRVKSLDSYSAMTIMPNFSSALECRHQLVLYEVILQTERLVTKHSSKIKAPGYDAVIGLLEKIIHLMPQIVTQDKLKQELTLHLNAIITIFEKLSLNDKYTGSKHKLYSLIDLCSDHLPEDSIISLITYRINDIYTTKPGWIEAVKELLKKYYILDTRPRVRSKSLTSLYQIFKSNKQIHEEEILKTLILPTVAKVDEEPQMSVKIEAIKMITGICSDCSSKKSVELLDILEKVITKPIEHKSQPTDFQDVQAAIDGLVEIFHARLCQHPASIVIRVYNILVKHLEMAYNNPDVFATLGSARKSIFQLFMKLRANSKFHLGVENGNKDGVHFSPYLICRSPLKEPSNPSGNIGKNVSYVSLSKACLMVIKCLSVETDYNVLTLVLEDVPLVLQNKAVFVLYGHNIKDFINPLIDLTTLPQLDSLINLPKQEEGSSRKFSRGDFLNKIYPVLAAIAPYSEYLEKSFSQSKVTRSIVTCLLQGLSWRESSRTCIVALTACSLEMPKTMYTMIEKVLLDFSKISATKHVAVPMLEFLSTLIRLPEVFCSFIDKSYFTVFAIALPFTNPFKFDAYTVSLAHHVIIMWFLKCRLAFRQNFVSFIVNGLNNNIMKSFEEGGFRRGSIIAREGVSKTRPKSGGSSDAGRLRSNSLSEHSPDKGKIRHATGQNPQPLTAEEEKLDKMVQFHSELSDTCVDILATYMFANVAVKPKRMPTANFLLKNGQSASWVIGTKIVTVTTSICDQTSSRGGSLCDRCHLLCSRLKSNQASETTEGRHKSSETIPSSSMATSEQDADLTNTASRRRHMSDAVVGSPSKHATNMPALNNPVMTLEARRGSSDISGGCKDVQPPPPKLESLLDTRKSKRQAQELCSCWCNGWAEIHVRRPSGEVSWITRIQNASLTSESHAEFPLSDLTTLFHPDKEEDAEDLVAMESLDTASTATTVVGAGESFSIFNRRGSADSSASTSAPNSPTKEVKQLDFPSQHHPSTDQISSPRTKSPASCKTPTPALEKDGISKQSYDAIPEVDDEEDFKGKQQDPVGRRKSLQSSSGQELNLVLVKRDSDVLATPPRTPVSKESSSKHFSKTRAEVLQTGSYGSAGATMRDRAHTISGPSPRRSGLMASRQQSSGSFSSSSRPYESSSMGSSSAQPKMERVTGISPQFVFLTMYHSQCFGNIPITEKPLLINMNNKSIESSVKVLDRTYPHETHKIGVLYIGPGQAQDETAILANTFGSLRYADFLHGLGSLICLRDVDRQTTFVGGLDTEDGDGDYAYMWEDDVMQVIFHVATLMPNHPETDPRCNKKKRHIGNDFVAIVYNNAGENKEYKLGTVKGQFIYACVIITPLDQGSNRVEIQCLPLLEEPLEHIKDAKIVSDRNLAVLVRQVALHCNLAAQIQRSVSSGREPYASNWLERLRAIKRIREKVINEANGATPGATTDSLDNSKNNAAANDFTAAVIRR